MRSFTVSVFQIVLASLVLVENKSSPIPGGTFQKPHFQVEHKAGILSIEATKSKATVDVKSDTIRLVVKPGDKQYPAQASPDVKTVMIEPNPIQALHSCCEQRRSHVNPDKSAKNAKKIF